MGIVVLMIIINFNFKNIFFLPGGGGTDHGLAGGWYILSVAGLDHGGAAELSVLVLPVCHGGLDEPVFVDVGP